MEVIKTAIDGVLIIEPKVFGDKRGYFFESYSQREFDEKVALPSSVRRQCSSTSAMSFIILKLMVAFASWMTLWV